MKRRAWAFAIACALVSAGLACACADPAHDEAVAALGAEKDGVEPGPYHRPGQPCVVCHGGSGPAKSQFSIAGTVYATKTAKDPAEGVDVQLTGPLGPDGGTFHAKTNKAGNFYVDVNDFSPTYPMHVVLIGSDGMTEADMLTHIAREGSCAGCHYDPAGPRTPGHVFLVDDTLGQ